MSSKQLFFLVSLPRAGNSLLTSILNQNKTLCVTANSITFEIIHQLNKIKDNNIFKNFPDHDSFDNITKNVFNNYYSSWNFKYIIDRSPTALTPANLTYYNHKDFKYIILKRNVQDIVKSFFTFYKKNGYDKSDADLYNEILHPDLMLCKSSLSIINGYKVLDKNQYLDINYEDIIKSPKTVIDSIYDFLNINKFEHYFTNMGQININNHQYNDEALEFSKNMHTIRTEKITKNIINLELPKEIKDKCEVLNNLLSNSSSI